MEILNAIITSTQLGHINGSQDFRLILHLAYYGDYHEFKVREVSSIEYLSRLLKIVGANEWEDLKDKSCRIAIDKWDVIDIGHIVYENWLNGLSCPAEKQAD